MASCLGSDGPSYKRADLPPGSAPHTRLWDLLPRPLPSFAREPVGRREPPAFPQIDNIELKLITFGGATHPRLLFTFKTEELAKEFFKQLDQDAQLYPYTHAWGLSKKTVEWTLGSEVFSTTAFRALQNFYPQQEQVRMNHLFLRARQDL